MVTLRMQQFAVKAHVSPFVSDEGTYTKSPLTAAHINGVSHADSTFVLSMSDKLNAVI